MGETVISLIVRCCLALTVIAFISMLEPSTNFVEEVKAATDYTSGSIESCVASADVSDCKVDKVPIRVAIWIFLVVLIAFVGLSNRKKV